MSEDKDKLKEYIVRGGKTFGVDNKQAGESVFLTDAEAAPFSDLVEPRVKPRKGEDQNTDTRDTAKNEENIGNKSADIGTAKTAKK